MIIITDTLFHYYKSEHLVNSTYNYNQVLNNEIVIIT